MALFTKSRAHALYTLTLLALLTFTFGVSAPVYADVCTEPSFKASATFGPGRASAYITTADFNGDGNPDVVASIDSGKVSVLLGDGKGGFGPAANFSSAGFFTAGIAIGDFNGDGKLDLAVTNTSTDNVSILLGAGTGSFGAATNFTVHSSPRSVATGDFNGDGKVDLAVANYNSADVSILLGTGTGSFGAATNLNADSFPQFIVARDFNHDSKPDLAVAHYSGEGRLLVYMGTGAGGFAAPNALTVAPYGRSIAAGDFNGDGETDLAVGASKLSILLGTGTGSFGPTTDFGPNNIVSLALRDFNHDGKPDLAVGTSAGQIVTMLGDVLGGRFVTGGSVDATSGLSSLAAEDFNGDGEPDLIASNTQTNTVTFLRGNGAGSFLAAPTLVAGTNPYTVVTGDFNKDGKIDAAFGDEAANNVTVLLGNGAGSLGAPANFSVGAGRRPWFTVTDDFNGDGNPDLVTANFFGNLSVLLGDGTGSFGPVTSVALAGSLRFVAVGDFNSDGKKDLAVSRQIADKVTVLLGNGAGGFGPPTDFNAFLAPEGHAIAVDDFNNDGKADLALSGVGQTAILLGNGAGGFGAPIIHAVPGYSNYIVAKDFNADGKADLAVTNDSQNKVSILLGEGAGIFAPPVSYDVGVRPWAIVSGDFNGDAKFDLAVSNEGSQNVTILLGDGAGKFPSTASFAARFPHHIAAGDLNGDGQTDLISNGGPTILLNSCGATPPPIPTISLSDASVVEGDTGTTGAQFTLTLSNPYDQTVSVSYQPGDQTATGGLDYRNMTGRISFAPGVTTQTFGFPIINDTLDELDEAFTLSLSVPYNVKIGDGQGVATIQDNDPPPTISVNDIQVTEGHAGTLTANFTASLSTASGLPITVAYATADGTATTGSDYASASGALAFNPGETSKSISVTINGDTTGEPNETFFVNLSNPVNVTMADGQGLGTIIDDDALSVQFSQAAYSISESSSSLNIIVTRSGDLSSPAKVRYSTSDSTDANFRCAPGTAGQATGVASRKCDYHIAVGTLRFAAGEAAKQLTLSLVNDVYVEGAESFTLTLTNPSGATLGQTHTVQVTINDDDATGAANPVDNTSFFVRQLYVDLLSREPDPAGWSGWTTRIDQCGQPDQPPPPCDRVTVGGDGFLRSGEFFDRQFFVLRLYRTGLGRILRYDEVGDLAYVSGFLTESDLELNKQDLVADIITRAEFANRYNPLSNSGFVATLLETAGVSVPQGVQDGWVTSLDAGSKTRAQVFREISERPEVSNKYAHEAQVVSAYYGFFTRNPDGAYLSYLQRLDSGEINLADLANAFINAQEYRQRFGQ